MADYVDDEFEWDVAKSDETEARRGINFRMASQAFACRYLMLFDEDHSDGEERFKAVAAVCGIFITVIYTSRGSRKRIISARRATKHDIDAYAQEFGIST